jgi:DNA-binding IclR family transcriptional regulator
MPGLSLTLTQAQRLWGLDRGTCAALLSSLVRAGFLLERRDGSYVRARTGHERSATTNRLGGRP